MYEKIRQKTHAGQDEGKTCRKVFGHFDKERFGTVYIKEFSMGLETLGCYFSKAEIQALFNKHDPHHSTMVDYEVLSGNIAVRGAGFNPNVKN